MTEQETADLSARLCYLRDLGPLNGMVWVVGQLNEWAIDVEDSTPDAAPRPAPEPSLKAILGDLLVILDYHGTGIVRAHAPQDEIVRERWAENYFEAVRARHRIDAALASLPGAAKTPPEVA